MILRLALADEGQYVVQDTELPGFFLVVGARKKTFTVRGEFWKDGKRFTKKVALGSSEDVSTRHARVLAKEALAKIARGEFAEEKAKVTIAAEVTLRMAWARYRTAHMERKERSEATIRGYADHVERVMKDWLDLPLKTLGENPRMVAERHDKITANSGPAAANGCMRTLRAVYNHARRSARELPPDNPTLAVDWNQEKRRDTALGAFDLPRWPRGVRDLAAVCRTFQLDVAMHSGVEFGVELAAMLHTASTIPEMTFAGDAHYHYLEDDIIEGGLMLYRDGVIAVPRGPGLGVALDPEKMDKYERHFEQVGDYYSRSLERS